MIVRNFKPSLALGSFSFHPKLIFIAILLVAYALRVARLDFQPLWWDEGYSLFFATRDLATMLDRTALDIHPPLYYAILQLWMLFAGKSDIAVRFFSVAIGAASVPLLYALARRLLGPTIALIATFLLAISPMQVYYSQEVRMYGLVTFFGIASVYLFVKLLAAPDGKSKTPLFTVVYILVTTAALYTQYFAAFILALQVLIVLLPAIRNQSLRFTLHALRFWLFAWASIALLYLPWLIYAGSKLYAYVTFKVRHEAYPPQDPVSFLVQHLAAFSLGHVSAWPLLIWATLLFVLLAALGVYALFHRRVSASPGLPIFPSPALLTTLYLLLPLGLDYLVNLLYPFHPIRYERLLLLASPAFYLLIASGVAAIKRRAFALSALIALFAFSFLSLFDFYTVARYPDDDYRPLIAQVQTLAQPGDNFLAIYPWQIGYLESYYHGASLNIVETPNDDWIKNQSQMQRDVDALLEKHPRVWVPALQTLGRIVEDALDANLRPKTFSVLDSWFGTTRLELFAAAEDPQRAAQQLSFGNGLTLSNWGMSRNTIVSGLDVARVWFDWGADSPERLKLSLRLVDSNRNVWSQDDREVERGVQRIGLAITAGTPPGTYDLQLSLYRENEASTRPVSLGIIQVETNQQPNLAAIPHRAESNFANGMRLVGYDATWKLLKPGETSGMTLFWQATQKQSLDYSATIQLQDASGKQYLTASDAIALGIYSPSRWRNNELIRDPRTFTVPGDMRDGTYSLMVSLVDPATQARVKTADGRDSVQLMTVQVKGRQHYFGVPSPSHETNVRFGDYTRLVGYDSIRSERNLRVVLYWQALGALQISYKGFVHILDSSGQLITQRDQIPGAGALPTTSWVKGEYLVDVYDIALPNDLNNYQIHAGLYDPASGVRIIAYDAAGNQVGDSLVLK